MCVKSNRNNGRLSKTAEGLNKYAELMAVAAAVGPRSCRARKVMFGGEEMTRCGDKRETSADHMVVGAASMTKLS